MGSLGFRVSLGLRFGFFPQPPLKTQGVRCLSPSPGTRPVTQARQEGAAGEGRQAAEGLLRSLTALGPLSRHFDGPFAAAGQKRTRSAKRCDYLIP